MLPMSRDRAARVWEELRRTLGHFAGKVATKSLPDSRMAIDPSIGRVDISARGLAQPGSREATWKPAAVARQGGMLALSRSDRGQDLAAISINVGANQSLGALSPTVTGNCCPTSAEQVNRVALSDMDAPAVHCDQVQLVAFDKSCAITRSDAPAIKSVVSFLELPRDGKTHADWRMPAISQRVDIAPALRVPLCCERIPARPGQSIQETFLDEVQQLAVASKVPESDITLLGVFPHVPLATVKKLSVSRDGVALDVWLDADRMKRGAKSLTVSVVLGRQLSTGRLVQAVLTKPAAANH